MTNLLIIWKTFLQWIFLLSCLVPDVWTGDLTSMPSDQRRVVAVFESLKFIKEQSNVSPSQACCRVFCELASACCLLLQPCGAPVKNLLAVLFMLRPRFSLELQFFRKTSCLHSSAAAETHSLSACQSPSWINPVIEWICAVQHFNQPSLILPVVSHERLVFCTSVPWQHLTTARTLDIDLLRQEDKVQLPWNENIPLTCRKSENSCTE